MADPTPERIAAAVADLKADWVWVENNGARTLRTWCLVHHDDATALLTHIDALTGDLADLHARYDGLTTVLAQVQRERDEARAARDRRETVDLAASLAAAQEVHAREEMAARTALWRRLNCPACLRGIDHQHATAGEEEAG